MEKKNHAIGSSCAAKYNESTEENEILEELKSGPVTVKQTYYYSNRPEWKILGTSSNTYGTLLGRTYSWLASLCVNCDSSSCASFEVYRINSGGVDSWHALNSITRTFSGSLGVRTLVTLSSSVLEENGVNGDFTTWTIKD